MRTNDKGLSLIKKYEGLELEVYKDAVGLPTIGYGHLIKPGESFSRITEAEAEELLIRDIQQIERSVNRLLNVPLTDNQYSAVVSFCFNLGTGAFQASTLRRVINRGDFDDAPEQFNRWVYAGGRKLRGLVRRRAEEARLFSEG